MIEISPSTISCGVDELSFVRELKTEAHCIGAIKTVYEECAPPALYLFSDIVEGSKRDYTGGGERLAEFIRNNRLGRLQQSPARLNFNSGNTIRTWMWTPPRKLTKGLKAIGIQRVWTPESWRKHEESLSGGYWR